MSATSPPKRLAISRRLRPERVRRLLAPSRERSAGWLLRRRFECHLPARLRFPTIRRAVPRGPPKLSQRSMARLSSRPQSGRAEEFHSSVVVWSMRPSDRVLPRADGGATGGSGFPVPRRMPDGNHSGRPPGERASSAGTRGRVAGSRRQTSRRREPAALAGGRDVEPHVQVAVARAGRLEAGFGAVGGDLCDEVRALRAQPQTPRHRCGAHRDRHTERGLV